MLVAMAVLYCVRPLCASQKVVTENKELKAKLKKLGGGDDDAAVVGTSVCTCCFLAGADTHYIAW